jgi:hypothetical protein
MNKLIESMKGKKVDIAYGANSTVRGDVIDVKEGVLYLRDEEDRIAYVMIDRIAVVWEVKESQARPGFVL